MTGSPPPEDSAQARARLETASQWLLRRADAAFTPADEAAFEAWLRQDPRNAEAHARIARLWASLGDTSVAVARRPPALPPRPSRRWMLGAGLTTAACAGLAWMRPAGLSPDGASTARSTSWDATAELALPDGSRVYLNRRSAIETRVSQTTRLAALAHGEAFFDIVHAPQAPFRVATADAIVTVLGTAFNVQSENGLTRVDVRSGRVQVRARQGAQALTLEAGEAARTSPDGRLHRIDGPADADSWRSGRLTFREAPVTDVAHRLSRYRATPVHLIAPDALARLRVSGMARTDQPDAFLTALPSLVPVAVRREPDGGLQIAPR